MKLINQSLCLLGMVCLMASCSSDPVSDVSDTANLETPFERSHDQAFADEVLSVINAHRADLGLEVLDYHHDARLQAVNHTNYMIEQNVISHDNFSKRSDYLKAKGAEEVSENVAYGYKTPEAVVEGWLQSEAHREAIESDYVATGIGVMQNKNGIYYYTQIFLK